MKVWVAGARPRTLVAAVVPVAVGTAVAAWEADLVVWRVVAALATAGALQIGTNFANDYQDGVRGTDEDRVGPTRLVAAGLASAAAVKRAALGSFGVAAAAGLSLALAVGPELLVVGAASIAAGWFYTGGPRPYGYAGFGELFVFVFFGLVATVGSAYVHTEDVTVFSVDAAVPVGLWATALLMVNNLRDIPGDTRSGKRTLAVRLGDANTRWFLIGLLVASLLAVVPVALTEPWALLALLASPLALGVIRPVRAGAEGTALIPVLGATAGLQAAAGLLLTLGVALGA